MNPTNLENYINQSSQTTQTLGSTQGLEGSTPAWGTTPRRIIRSPTGIFAQHHSRCRLDHMGVTHCGTKVVGKGWGFMGTSQAVDTESLTWRQHNCGRTKVGAATSLSWVAGCVAWSGARSALVEFGSQGEQLDKLGANYDAARNHWYIIPNTRVTILEIGPLVDQPLEDLNMKLPKLINANHLEQHMNIYND